MKIKDITEGYKVLPPIDKERYQARDGLEGPFRLRNGKVVYYDPQEGSYYDPDTDMYISYDDYKKMDEADDVSTQIADLVRKKNSVTSPIARKNIDSQIALLKRKRDKTNEEKGVAEGDKRPSYIAKASSRPKKVKPSTGGSSPHPYQGKLVGESEVSNTDYEWTHGKKPKGTGSWFFVAHKGGVNFGKDVEGEDYIQLNQMSYADAKKAAIKWAKSKGHTSLYVGT